MPDTPNKMTSGQAPDPSDLIGFLGAGLARRVGLIAMLAIVYFVAAKLGYSLGNDEGKMGLVPVFWPANGIALAVLLLGGAGLWPGIVIGAALANISAGAPIISALEFGIGMAFEAYLGFYLINAGGGASRINNHGSISFSALFGAGLILPAIGVTTLYFSGSSYGVGTFSNSGSAQLLMWSADAVGIFCTLPMVIALFHRDRSWINTANFTELAAIILASVILGAMVFQTAGTAVTAALFPFLLFPVVVWGGVRQGLRGGAISATIIAIMAALSAGGNDVLHNVFGATVITQTGFGLESFALGGRSTEGFTLDFSRTGTGGFLVLNGYMLAIALCGFAVGSAREIAERRIAGLYANIEQLSLDKSEIGQFTVAASQGLQESIRMVGSFAGLLDRRYRDQLDDEAREYIDYLTAGARQMSDLVDDLTIMERVEERHFEFSVLKSSAIVFSVVESLAGRADRETFEISVGELPKIRGNSRQIRELITTLVTNCIDYRAANRPLEISISAFRRDSGWVFAIRDNGLGIAHEYLHTIFVPFRRLHSRKDVPGTGLGLSICKRIVERHGGQIWAESSVGQGTTLFFELPAVEDKLEQLTGEPERIGALKGSAKPK